MTETAAAAPLSDLIWQEDRSIVWTYVDADPDISQRLLIKACACLQHNVSHNSHLFDAGPDAARVRALDWTKPTGLQHAPPSSFCWSLADTDELGKVDIILAADVVYDEELTEALLGSAQQLLERAGPHMTQHTWQGMYMALEKRYNFTLRDLDATAPAYNHFRSMFNVPSADHAMSAGSTLQGKQIPVNDIPQLIQYKRGSDLELWHITLSTHERQ